MLVTEVFLDVQTEECMRVEVTHQSEVGTLIPSDENTLKTSNILIPNYSWLSTKTIVVPNMIFSYTTVLANLNDGSVSHALLEHLSCIELDHFLSCREEGWRLITSRVRVEKCKQPRAITDATLEIFTLESGELHRVQDANLTFHVANTLWTAITMIGVFLIVLNLFLTKRKRRRNEEGEAEPPVEG